MRLLLWLVNLAGQLDERRCKRTAGVIDGQFNWDPTGDRHLVEIAGKGLCGINVISSVDYALIFGLFILRPVEVLLDLSLGSLDVAAVRTLVIEV